MALDSYAQVNYMDSIQQVLLEKKYPERALLLIKVLDAKELNASEKMKLIAVDIEKLEQLNAYPILLSKLYLEMADFQLKNGDSKMNIPYILKTKRLVNKYGEENVEWFTIQGNIHNAMSFNYYWNFETEKAIEECKKAYEFFISAQDTLRMGRTLNTIGIIYSESEDSEKAIEYYDRAMDFFLLAKREKWILRSSFCKVVDLVILERWKEANALLREILPRMKATNHINYNIAFVKLGQIEMSQGNYGEAERLMQESLDNALAANKWNGITVASEQLVALKEEQGDYKAALEFLTLKNLYSDSLNFEMNDNKRLAAQAEYEELDRQQKIKDLEYQQTLQQSKFRIWIAALSGLFLLCLSGVVLWLFRQSEQKKRTSILAAKEKEVQKVRERLLTSITHELRTPLTLIIGQADELKKQELNAAARPFAEGVGRNAAELLDQINQLLDWNRVEANAIEVEQSIGDVFSTIQQTYEQIEGSSFLKKMNWNIDLPAGKLTAKLDFNKLQTIVRNLLTNAFKFTPENGHVTLSARLTDQNQLQITVSDSGPGIPLDQQEKIFDWYFRAQQQREESIAGFGVGLALSKELAQLMGGDLYLESAEGKGANFKLMLPIVKVENTDLASLNKDSQKVVKPSQDLEKLNGVDEKPLLLLVEDHTELANHISLILSKTFTVISTASALTGMQIALSKMPDIVLTDLMLPKKNGLEFCKELKEHLVTDHIPVVILTARAELSTKYKSLENHADAFLTKPFKSEELILTLQNLIKNRERLKEKFQNGKLSAIEKQIENPFVRSLRNIIQENYSDNSFNVDAFATKMNISRVQLFKKTKALIGNSPSVLIKKHRLKTAKKLLETGQKTVAETAYSCGFSTPEYFSTVFKEEYKLSPKEVSKIQS